MLVTKDYYPSLNPQVVLYTHQTQDLPSSSHSHGQPTVTNHEHNYNITFNSIFAVIFAYVLTIIHWSQLLYIDDFFHRNLKIIHGLDWFLSVNGQNIQENMTFYTLHNTENTCTLSRVKEKAFLSCKSAMTSTHNAGRVDFICNQCNLFSIETTSKHPRVRIIKKQRVVGIQRTCFVTMWLNRPIN